MSLDLHDCAKRGDVIHLQLMLSSRSAAPNARERGTRATALHHAVLEQHTEAVELLLNFRADCNLFDKDKRTPLHNVVTKQADAEAAQTIAIMLLGAGADPTLKNKDGDTILHLAAREGHLSLLTFLLDDRKGELDVDCYNDKDETPLFFAAGNSHVAVVLELLRRGANPNIPNRKGRTPLHMALRWAKSDVKKVIEKAAAQAAVIEHVTLPSGTVIRKDLLPDSFNDVMQRLRSQRGETRTALDEAAASPPGLRGFVPDAAEAHPSSSAYAAEHSDSFAAQVNLLGNATASRGDRLHHLSASPLASLQADMDERFGGGGGGGGSAGKDLPSGVATPGQQPLLLRKESMRSFGSQQAPASQRSGSVSGHDGPDGESTAGPPHPPPQFGAAAGGGGGGGAASPPTGSAHRRRLELERERERLAEKERMRVDQRLRGLFYAGLKRSQKGGGGGGGGGGRGRGGDEEGVSGDDGEGAGGAVGGVGGADAASPRSVLSPLPLNSPGGGADVTGGKRVLTQKEEELDALTAEIQALREAGFKDPSKGMRRLEREQRREARTERKAQRERERLEEEGDRCMDDEVAGEISAQLLEKDVSNVIPANTAFTLRRVVDADNPSLKNGLYGIINGLEGRIKNMSQLFYDLDKRCESLQNVHEVIRREARSGRGRKFGGPTSPSRAGGGGGGNDISGLPRKDQRVLLEFEGRLETLENRARRDVKKKKAEARAAGSSSKLAMWLVRVFVLASVVAYFWLQSAVNELSPPPVWL